MTAVDITKTLTKNVPQGSKITFKYPDGVKSADLDADGPCILNCITKQATFSTSGQFSVKCNKASIVVTVLGNVTYQAGETVYLIINRKA